MRRPRTRLAVLGLVSAMWLCPAGAAHASTASGSGARALDEKLEREKADPGRQGPVHPFLERVWSWRRLYDDPANPVIQRFDVRGRFQADYAWVDADRGSYSEALVRRFRIGFESHWIADLELQVEVDFDLTCEKSEDCDEPAYEGLTEAALTWAPSPRFALKVGKHSAPFTLDGTTSSTRLITPERNNVTNNLWFTSEYHTGIAASGRMDPWRYRFGIFSSSTDEEFGDFDGSAFGLVSLSYDIPGCSERAECWVKLDYVYNEPDADNVGTRDLRHVGSFQFRYDAARYGAGRFGVRADLSGGIGYFDQPDLAGLALVPYFHLTPTVMLVARYTFLYSFDPGGIRFNRYASEVESDRGERYNELFLGANWFLYGHRLKLQTGLTWTRMDELAEGGDYEGWGWTAALRVSW